VNSVGQRQTLQGITRKLSYGKDDRTMRPIIWVSWKFSRGPEYAHGYFSRNF